LASRRPDLCSQGHGYAILGRQNEKSSLDLRCGKLHVNAGSGHWYDLLFLEIDLQIDGNALVVDAYRVLTVGNKLGQNNDTAPSGAGDVLIVCEDFNSTLRDVNYAKAV
jgi:hypothetical protein